MAQQKHSSTRIDLENSTSRSLHRPDVPELMRKLQRDLPHVVAAAMRLSEEMEGLWI